MASFSECVIVPLDLWKQCSNNSSSSVLFEDDLPADVKIKLYQQEQKLKSTKPVVTTSGSDVKSILQAITDKNKWKADVILNKILQKRDVISWNNRFEVAVNQIPYPNSNIIDILKHLLGDSDASGERPSGIGDFRAALINLNIPANWLKEKYKHQVGYGWINL